MNPYKLLILPAFFLLMLGCDDVLDIDQPGILYSENTFENIEDLELGLSAVNAGLSTYREVEFAAIFTDEVSIGVQNGGQGIGDGGYAFVLDATSTAPAAIWVGNYRTINLATRLIEAANRLSIEAEEQARYDQVLGQSYAIRAYAHFVLQSYFTTDYKDDNALGVIAVDFIPENDQELPRNTNAEVFALIERDLASAEALLSADSDPTVVDLDFITAIRARMALYRGKYTDAITHANGLFEKFELATRQQYINMFLDQDNTEVIFKLERTVGDGKAPMGGAFAFTDATLNGGAFFEIGLSLLQNKPVQDVRSEVILAPSSIFPDYLIIQKYPGSEDIPLMNDLKIFRTSEMVLIMAEAYAQLDQLNNGLESAGGMLNLIQSIRLGGAVSQPFFDNKAEALGAILDERRSEFAFEGHRWLDLKRIGIEGNRAVDRDPFDCSGVCDIASDDHRFTMPIPQTELNANAVLQGQQNPGY